MTPYQELIERVRKIDKEAAEYLERDAPVLKSFAPADNLHACFIWATTPKGEQYWNNLSYLLGEWE